MDIKSPQERSRNMANIKNARTRPEMFVRSRLHRRGLRYRVNCKEVTGKPDLYFSRRRVAVFVHGCFWHRHPGCKYAYTPKSRQEFWLPKLEGNRRRDLEVRSRLAEQGVRVLIVWECTVKRMMKDADFCEAAMDGICRFLLESELESLEV